MVTASAGDYTNTKDGNGAGANNLFLGANHARVWSSSSANDATTWGTLARLTLVSGTAPPPGATIDGTKLGVNAINTTNDNFHGDVHRVVNVPSAWSHPDNPWTSYTLTSEFAPVDVDEISATAGDHTEIPDVLDDLIQDWVNDDDYEQGDPLGLALLGRSDEGSTLNIRTYDNDPGNALYVDIEWTAPAEPVLVTANRAVAKAATRLSTVIAGAVTVNAGRAVAKAATRPSTITAGAVTVNAGRAVAKVAALPAGAHAATVTHTAVYAVTAPAGDYTNTRDGLGASANNLFLTAKHGRVWSSSIGNQAAMWGMLARLTLVSGQAPPPGAVVQNTALGVNATSTNDNSFHGDIHRVLNLPEAWTHPDNPWTAYTLSPAKAAVDVDGISATAGTHTEITGVLDSLVQGWIDTPGYSQGDPIGLALLGRDNVTSRLNIRTYDDNPDYALYLKVTWAEVIEPVEVTAGRAVARVGARPATVAGGAVTATTRYRVTAPARDFSNLAEGGGGHSTTFQHVRIWSGGVVWDTIAVVSPATGEPVPAGATILSARLGLNAINPTENDVRCDLYTFHNPPAALTSSDTRATYTPSGTPVLLTGDDIPNQAGVHAEFDVTDQIHAHVNDGDYTTGDDIGLLFLGRSDVQKRANLRAFDNDPAAAIYLDVEWTTGDAATVVTANRAVARVAARPVTVGGGAAQHTAVYRVVNFARDFSNRDQGGGGHSLSFKHNRIWNGVEVWDTLARVDLVDGAAPPPGADVVFARVGLNAINPNDNDLRTQVHTFHNPPAAFTTSDTRATYTLSQTAAVLSGDDLSNTAGVHTWFDVTGLLTAHIGHPDYTEGAPIGLVFLGGQPGESARLNLRSFDEDPNSVIVLEVGWNEDTTPVEPPVFDPAQVAVALHVDGGRRVAAVNTASADGATNPAVTVTATAAGQTVVGIVAVEQGVGDVFTLPAGWTLVTDQGTNESPSDVNLRVVVAERRVDGPGPVTFDPVTGGADWVAFAVVYEDLPVGDLVVDAGPDQTVQVGDLVVLHVHAEDTAAAVATVELEQDSGPVPAEVTHWPPATWTFVPGQPGDYEFTATAVNDLATEVTDDVKVTAVAPAAPDARVFGFRYTVRDERGEAAFDDTTVTVDPGLSPTTGGTGGQLADLTFETFEDSTGLEGSYHLYADGLDWDKPVGILIYTDGSGDWGLNNPTSTYLLAGTTGLIATAKKHNMILLTPFAPGDGCTDGDGVCWYLPSFDGTSQAAKIAWCRELVDHVYSRYDIALDRVALGGYSSGAQWLTQFFGPSHAAEIMAAGVCVAISYGGEPLNTPHYPTWFKLAVPFVWDVGDQDPAWTNTESIYRVPKGHAWYTAAGFTTDLVLHEGVGHDRTGDFGPVMDREITARVKPA